MTTAPPACHTWPAPLGQPLELRTLCDGYDVRWRPAPPVETIRYWQDGRCAVCGYTRAKLVKDHCHETGLVRGLLCGRCNTIEARGDWFDCSGGGAVFESYRRLPPAVILGTTQPYESVMWGLAWPTPFAEHVLGQRPVDVYEAALYLADAIAAQATIRHAKETMTWRHGMWWPPDYVFEEGVPVKEIQAL